MKKIKYLLFTFFIALIGIVGVKADKTYSIDVTMDIDSNGNAKIVEKWDFKATDGTEIYKPIGELGNSKITNFKASMDGTEFTFEPNWDVDASLAKKAYKNGYVTYGDYLYMYWGQQLMRVLPNWLLIRLLRKKHKKK